MHTHFLFFVSSILPTTYVTHPFVWLQGIVEDRQEWPGAIGSTPQSLLILQQNPSYKKAFNKNTSAKLTWNPKIQAWKRRNIYKPPIFWVPAAIFRGVYSSFAHLKIAPKTCHRQTKFLGGLCLSQPDSTAFHPQKGSQQKKVLITTFGIKNKQDIWELLPPNDFRVLGNKILTHKSLCVWLKILSITIVVFVNLGHFIRGITGPFGRNFQNQGSLTYPYIGGNQNIQMYGDFE